MNQWWLVPIFFGAFGGMAPQILETLQDAEALGVPFWEIPAWPGRFGALPVYGSIGAMVALANRETDMMKSIQLGICAPALMLAFADDAEPPVVALQALEAPPAAVQEAIPDQETTRTLTIEVQNRLVFDKTAVIHRAEGSPTELRETETGTWFVPTAGFSMSLKGTTPLGDVIVPVETPVIRVPPGSGPIVIRLTTTLEQTNFGGFLDALGFDRIARERYTDLNPRLVIDEADADEPERDTK